MAGNNTCRESGSGHGRGAVRFSPAICRRGYTGDIKVKKLKSQKGISLMETVIAVAIMGIIAVAFLSALATTSSARATNDERTAAKILAEDIIENIKSDNFSRDEYVAVVPAEFPGYTVDPNPIIPVNTGNGIQKITVVVFHHGHEVLRLESYKVDR